MAADKSNKPPHHKSGGSHGSKHGGIRHQPPIPSFLDNGAPPPSQGQSQAKRGSEKNHPMRESTPIPGGPSKSRDLPSFWEGEDPGPRKPRHEGPAADFTTPGHHRRHEGDKSYSNGPEGPGESDANFAWIQEYLAKSNQYFFSISRFTVVGLTGTLCLLGVLFFVAGFSTAFWLIAFTDVLNKRGLALEQQEIQQVTQNVRANAADINQNTNTVSQAQKQISTNTNQILANQESLYTDQDRIAANNRHIEETQRTDQRALSALNEKAQGLGHEITKLEDFQRKQEAYNAQDTKEQSQQNQDLWAIEKNIHSIQEAEDKLKDELNTPAHKVAAVAQNFHAQKNYKTIVLFASPLPNSAIEKARSYERKGYSVYIVKHTADASSPTTYRVQLGAYLSEKFAQNVLHFIKKQQNDPDVAIAPSILKDAKERIIYPQ